MTTEHFTLELKDGVCILQAGDGSVTCFILSRVMESVDAACMVS